MRNNLKFLFGVLFCLIITLILPGCECKHIWVEADCITPKTCSACKITEGDAKGHNWKDADCVTPQTCSDCKTTEGRAKGHDWKAADCVTPKTCSECKTTEGDANGHEYNEAIVTQATCNMNGVKKFSCENCNYNYNEDYSLDEFSATDIFNLSQVSVGEIITYDKNGSELAIGTGFVYKSNEEIITNYHVIEKACSAKITINGIEYDVKQVIAYDKSKDIAILKINANNLKTLPICSNQHVVGASVYAIGSSKGLTATFSQGIITYASREIDSVTYVQHDAPISSGNSGGPLINQYGEIIGINTMSVKDSQNLNFAISMKELNYISYITPITLAEFYEKECDVFSKIKNYVTRNGTYDSSDKAYWLTIGYTNSSNNSYTRKIHYNVAKDELSIILFMNSNYLITITIDEIDGVYQWGWSEKTGDGMVGTIYATTFTSNTLLGYSYCTSSYLASTIRKLASTMMSLLCTYIDEDFKPIGVTAEDLGFLYF